MLRTAPMNTSSGPGSEPGPERDRHRGGDQQRADDEHDEPSRQSECPTRRPGRQHRGHGAGTRPGAVTETIHDGRDHARRCRQLRAGRNPSDGVSVQPLSTLSAGGGVIRHPNDCRGRDRANHRRFVGAGTAQSLTHRAGRGFGTVGRVQLNTVRSGSGPAIVFLHGLGHDRPHLGCRRRPPRRPLHGRRGRPPRARRLAVPRRSRSAFTRDAALADLDEVLATRSKARPCWSATRSAATSHSPTQRPGPASPAASSCSTPDPGFGIRRSGRDGTNGHDAMRTASVCPNMWRR